MSRITDASFWKEQATYRRGWNSSTTWASTSCALRDSRSGGAARTAPQVSRLLGCHCAQDVDLRGPPGGGDGGQDTGDPGEDEDRDQRPDREREDEPVGGQRPRDDQREGDAQDDAENGADRGGDHGLATDHLAHLAARHADGPQHPELASALVDRQRERVDDAEQRDDD